MTAIADAPRSRSRSLTRAIGWGAVILVSGMLLLYSVVWWFEGPATALENIAERTPLEVDAFHEGSPSAFDVTTIVVRSQAAYGAGLGGLGLLVAWHGFRTRSRWAWRASWVVPLAIAVAGLSFAFAGGAPIGGAYVALAVIAGIGLLFARSSLEHPPSHVDEDPRPSPPGPPAEQPRP